MDLETTPTLARPGGDEQVDDEQHTRPDVDQQDATSPYDAVSAVSASESAAGEEQFHLHPARARSNSSVDTTEEMPSKRRRLDEVVPSCGASTSGTKRLFGPNTAETLQRQRSALQVAVVAAEEADAVVSSLRASTGSISKDEKYYRADGDCIVQVEGTLFKIHRYHLADESSETSVFRGMFDLPPGDGVTPEGQTDCNPIVLYGDTAAQFRAFLSFSYSNPLQLQINRMTVDDLERLSKIVSFAHKYLLQDCLTWALESIEHVLLSAASMVPSAEYPVVLEATALCTPLHRTICENICGLLQRQWLSDIESYSLPIAPALDIAERLNLRGFLVELYCLVLDTLASTPAARRTADDGPLAQISPTHRLRIFSGNWFLSRSCSDFMDRKPPTISHSSTCATHLCGAFWYSGWGACAKRSMAIPDHGNLKRIFQKLDNFRDLLVLSRRGFCSGEDEMDAEINRFKKDLEQCFFSVAP